MTDTTQRRYLWFGWFVCGLAAVFYAYEYLLRITPSIIATDLRFAFGMTAGQFGLVTAFYYYAYTPMQLPVGLLMDRFGPRRLLVLACFACAIGTYLFAYTHELWIIALGRALQGFGSAFAFVGVLTLATIWLPARYFALVAGLATTLGMLGALFGDVLLAKIVLVSGWRDMLIFSAHMGLVLTLILWVCIRDSGRGQQKQVVQKQSTLTWRDLGAGVLAVIRNPQIWLAGVVGALLYLSLSAFAELWGVAYLEAAHNLAKTDAVTAVSMIFFGWAVGGPIAGLFSDRLRQRVLPLTVGALMAATLVAVLLYVPGLSFIWICIILFAYGLFCSAEVVVFAIGRECSAPRLAATAIAVTNMLIMSSGVVFQPLIGYLLDFFWSGTIVDQLYVYTAREYTLALSVLPVALVIAALLTLFLRETHAEIKE